MPRLKSSGSSQPGTSLRSGRGQLAKTDRLDARAYLYFWRGDGASYGHGIEAGARELRELESQRRHLSRLLVMEQNRGARLADSSVRVLNRSLIKQIQKQIEKIDLLD